MTTSTSTKHKVKLAIYLIAWVLSVFCFLTSLVYLPAGYKGSGPPGRMVWTAQYDIWHFAYAAACLIPVAVFSWLIIRSFRQRKPA